MSGYEAVRVLRKLVSLTPLGLLLDWMEAMTYRQGLMGALLGAGLALGGWLFSERPSHGSDALVTVLGGALLGCFWMIHISLGLLNGYARSIRWSGAVLGLFMLAVSLGHDEMTPYLALVTGVGFGSLLGATVPLALFRLCARCEPKSRLRRFSLALACPSIRFHEDNPNSIVSDKDPVEARVLLHQEWGIADRDDLATVLEALRSQDRLGQTVEVVRWAVTASMLGKSEGWAIVEEMGRRAQQLYENWEQFSLGDPLREGLRDSQQQLLSKRRGPWRRWPALSDGLV